MFKIENQQIYRQEKGESYEIWLPSGPEYRVTTATGVNAWDRFDTETGAYIPAPEHTAPFPGEPSTLEEAKSSKMTELNEACRQAIEAGFIYDGHLFKSAVDPDQTNIALAGLQFLMDTSATLPWETADNSAIITLTASTFPLFATAFGTHKMAQQVKVAQLKAQVPLAATMEEVAGIVW